MCSVPTSFNSGHFLPADALMSPDSQIYLIGALHQDLQMDKVTSLEDVNRPQWQPMLSNQNVSPCCPCIKPQGSLHFVPPTFYIQDETLDGSDTFADK